MRAKKRAELTEKDAMIVSVLQDNEKRANRLSRYLFVAGLTVTMLNILFNSIGLFKLDVRDYLVADIITAVNCLVPIGISFIPRVSQRTLRGINLICIVFFAAWSNLFFSYNITLLMAAPIVLAMAYFSTRTTVITYAVTVVAFGLSDYFGSLGYAVLDSNHVSVPAGTVLEVEETLKQTLLNGGFRNAQYTEKIMVLGYVPKLMVSVLLLVLSVAITRFGYHMLIRQAKQTAERTKIDTELQFAGALQAGALPSAEDINRRYPVEIAADMTAAKETGGDFYDFVMIDDTHLALVMADVCGKGVPAAMFMMSAKEKLRSALATGHSPGKILYEVNNRLCENNTRRMFVTIWLGIVDLTTGQMISANGGHEDPLIKKAAGEFVKVSEEHGVGAGVRPHREYPEQTVQLEPGDVLVQYTDGVTEARNEAGELYGEQRLLNGLNEQFAGQQPTAEQVRAGLKQQVADFAGNAEQADDITLLAFRF